MRDWFHALTGFAERSWPDTRAQLAVEGRRLRSLANGRSWGIGEMETPSVAELRRRARDVQPTSTGRLRVFTITADVTDLHRDSTHRHALVQVASQFNLLEMTGPDIAPEHGVTRYATDHTQGPACGIAAGAATIYRNYFLPVDGHEGQTATRQVDCLRDIGDALGNHAGSLWTMRNGYALCTSAGLASIGARLSAMSAGERDALRDRLRVGVHWDVEVTIADDPAQRVSQVFCSALPVAYSRIPAEQWAPFASLVLEGAYEATLWAAVLNAARTGSRLLFLTSLGGGAFGNDPAWIHAAIRRAVRQVRGMDLDVRLVSRGEPSAAVRDLVAELDSGR